MRRALATTALVGGLALTPLTAAPASAEAPAAAVLATGAGTDIDEPGAQDGDDDSGRWGLMGLLGLTGLFGYKKYKDHRASQRVGAVDTDGSGSRRV